MHSAPPSPVKAFFEHLQPFFAAEGYHFHPILNQFRQTFDGGFRNVIFGFSAYEDTTLVECTFGVRLDLIEDTIMPFSTGINGYLDESNTTQTNLAKYHQVPHYRLRFAHPAEMEAAGQELRQFFVQEGFAFLEKHSALKALEARYNQAPHQPSLLAFSTRMRCFRGMALATMAQSPYWESLYQVYQEELRRWGTPSIITDRYEALCQHLLRLGVN
ncbi:MAG: hypothetical protein RI565_03775 [Schleiferiaceae bacterium]|nr:hypothetical protein [Schleiferiaceae bacterium]